MKKLACFVLAAVLILCGCANSVTAPSTATPTTVATIAPTTMPPTTVPPTTVPPTTEPVVLQMYPLNPDSTYLSLTQELPAHIYNTLGSENGLAGTVYKISGTVEEYFTLDAGDGWIYENIRVNTGDGVVVISNFYKSLYNKCVLTYGIDYAKSYCIYDVNDYTFPDIGETAEFLVIYEGYSQTEEMPIFMLGANPLLFEISEYEDPAKATDE